MRPFSLYTENNRDQAFMELMGQIPATVKKGASIVLQDLQRFSSTLLALIVACELE